MDNKKIQLFTSLGNLERVNERFAKVKIRIAYEGENRNGSYISKETFEKAIPTLKYVPVVGYYLEDDKMFDGHTEKLEIVGDDWTWKSLTQPYGVVTDEAPFWEDVKTLNGEIKSYLTCYAMLWIARYPELEGIKEGDFAQSMELICNKGYWSEEDNLYHIEDFTFDALCILQKKEPCFEDSKITLNFSKEKFEEEYKSMITELKEYTFSLLEGGEKMEDNKEITTEELEVNTENEFAKEVEEREDEEMAKKKKCEADNEDEESEEMAKKKKCESETEDDSEEEKEDYEVKYNEVVEELNTLKADFTDLTSELEALKSDYSTLKTETEELRKYKSNVEFEQHKVEVDEVLAKYSELEAIDGYSELVKEKYIVDIEELEKAIKVFAFDNGVTLTKKNTKKNFSKENAKIPVINKNRDEEISEAEKRYGLGISKYIRK